MVPQLRRKCKAHFDHFSSEARHQTPLAQDRGTTGNVMKNPNLMVSPITSDGFLTPILPTLLGSLYVIPLIIWRDVKYGGR